MSEMPPEIPAQLSDEAAAQLLQSLLHKEGTWVDWGKACQQLQKAGYTPPVIFERTGFQGSHQNLIIVAAQVYDSLLKAGAEPELLSYFLGPRSDVLYELRILNQQQRWQGAALAKEKQLAADGAREVAKALQAFSRLSQLPANFTSHPGDAVAYQCWKLARQKKDPAERSRLIAKGLKFAHSPTARAAIEKLLGELPSHQAQAAPLMPLYRLESEEHLFRMVPVAGSLPLTKKKFDSVPPIAVQEPFGIVSASPKQAFLPLPGWQAILKAGDPVALLCQSDQLPKPLPGEVKEVLVVVDRAQREWDVNSYFLVEQKKKLALAWFAQAPQLPLLGQVILVLRPKKIFDEHNLTEPWQMDD
jgi:hypothetical protein